MKHLPLRIAFAATIWHSKETLLTGMSLNLAVKFRNARSRISLKETKTIGELKEEIAVSCRIFALLHRNRSILLRNNSESSWIGRKRQMTSKRC